MLHELVERDVGVPADVPPAPEVRLPEPLLEGQPAEGLHHELPLSEVGRLVHARQVSRQGADGAEYLEKKRIFKLITGPN